MATIEIAYRLHGKCWRRRSFKTEAAAELFLESIPARAEIKGSL